MTPVSPKDEKKYTYTAIIDRLGAMIRDGQLVPGDRLPPERKLAETLSVSRTSLRQALQALAERGVIESRQGDGTYLLTTLETPLAADAIVDTIAEQSGVLHDVLEFRRMMEPEIAALAARRITPEELDRLKVVLCDQQRALLAGRAEDRFDAEFHRLLVASADNGVIDQVMAAIQTIVDQSRSVWLQSPERRLASVEGHLRIIDALEARDAAAARRAMHDHLTEIEQHILGDQQE